MTMRAVVVSEWVKDVDELRISTTEVPQVKAGMVLVEVEYSGANFYDILMVQGKYQYRPSFPFVPGTEFAGTVCEVASDVTSWKVGDKVYGISNLGAYAEKILVPADKVRKIPRGMSGKEAAGFSMTYPTSYAGLVYRANVKQGDVVLVHAAAGGVGIAAVQIAKAFGAVVIATASSEEKLQVAMDSGADHVINYKTTDFVEKVKEITNGRGADIIYDPVGGDVFDKSSKCIAWGGKILVVGFAGGRIAEIKTNRILLKNCSIVGVFWGSYALHQPEKVEETFRAIEGLYEEGKLKPVVCGVFPLSAISKGLKQLGSRGTFGKLIICADGLEGTPNAPSK
eukprot:CAMPEP_0174251426 /NCGR_PEP_ID=MMETSP0439-20130205/1249_1 /TAXON_ID=0 /ORGANISM="Stereomyxa ramosa, Strain Chinc5" /LENGTH=339 /DNA_ID=CAMNT_0015331733 /DNA_START=37 /DNA_END=1053 /DNA_ORIENTATION=-